MTWRPSFPAKMSTEIAKLSAEVRALGELLHGVSSETFRNANGVYMKLMDLRRLEPGAGGEASGGLSGGSQADVEVWNAYAQNRTALATAAAAIRATLARVDADEDLRADLASADEPEIAEATEGALVTRLHRLGRDLSGRYGSEAYAMEECVADLAASFVLADLGIAHRPRPDHAAYLASWVKVLKHDPRAIFTAASKAQAVADWMTGQQPQLP
ncbi:MAG: hypothetical protein KGS44_15480, partial [Alphaproteobacteria bacterium]|nr:hypothetical protein [Alphaproteobacteria bacterium]